MVLSPFPLPQELIDIIIDAIQDDRASLKTCSYVSFPFKKSSQRHLFSHITLLPPRSARRPTQCQKLHEILLETPHLASYSTSLEILEGYQPSVSGVSVKLPWVTSESALELVLPLLPLRRFSLFCSWPGSLLSLALPVTLRTILYDVIKSDTLTSLTLGRIIFKPADFHFFLTGCTGLKELALFAVSVHSTSGFEADDEEKIESSTHRAQLDSFTAESDGEILDLLLSAESPVDLQCLRTLSLHGYLAARHLESLIQRPHATLQHFSIKELFDDSIDFDFTTVQHEHLRSLYIAPRWSQNMGKLLQKCSPRLERITLELSLPDFAADQWTEVDNLLARPEMVHLCAVVIKVHPGFEGQCWDQDSELIFTLAVDSVKRYLRVLSDRALLVVEQIPEYTKPEGWPRASREKEEAQQGEDVDSDEGEGDGDGDNENEDSESALEDDPGCCYEAGDDKDCVLDRSRRGS